MNRRSLLSLLVNTGAATSVGVVAVPAVVNALSPVFAHQGQERWQAIGTLEKIPIDEVQQVVVRAPAAQWPESFEPIVVFVWRISTQKVVVYSRKCTDLKCPLTYDAGSHCFFCPCHGGIFARNGQRMAGPPSRPMYRYAHRLRDGVLEIDLNSIPPIG